MSAFPNDVLYETRGWSEVAELAGHARMICSHAFDPRNRFVATGALDGSIRLWDLRRGVQLGEEMPSKAGRKSQPSKAVVCMQLTDSGERLLVGFAQLDAGEPVDHLRSISVWDVSEQLATMPGLSASFLADAWFGESGSSIVLVTGDDGGRFASFIDASLPDQEVPPDVWRLAQEVSGYQVSQQIRKSADLPNAAGAVSNKRNQTISVSSGGASSSDWLNWYLSAPEARTISPFSKVKASEYLRMLKHDMRTQRFLLEAFEMDPHDNLNLANLALLTDDFDSSEAMWKVAFATSSHDKDILFRRAVRLFENNWYETSERAHEAAERLTSIVRTNLEKDLSWSPKDQGLVRNMAFRLNREGFLKIVAHSGNVAAAKQASLLSLAQLGDIETESARNKYLKDEYSNYPKGAAQYSESNLSVSLSLCAAEIRRAFWLDQAGHSMGKGIAHCWVESAPDIFFNALVHDADNWHASYPAHTLPFWDFAYNSFRDTAREARPDQSNEVAQASGSIASFIALKLIESNHQGVAAEVYAREGLSQRQKAGVTGWPLANSKSLVGAALFQQNKLSEAEPFVAEGAKDLLSLKDTVPEEARLRVVEAVDRAKSLYEKTGNQAQASYWSAELEKLQNDPRYALLE